MKFQDKLSVKGAGKMTVGSCAACDGEKKMLGWRESDLGLICRDCAVLLINAELNQIFPKGGVK